MPQIDLTPTLSLLLGLPIPWSNLGKLDPQLWRMAAGGGEEGWRRRRRRTRQGLRLTRGQVRVQWREQEQWQWQEQWQVVFATLWLPLLVLHPQRRAL